MIGFILLLLVAVAVVAAVIVFGMLYDVALGEGGHIVSAREGEARRWTPPYIGGRDLFQWARSMTMRAVDEVLREGADASTARRIVGRLAQGSDRAMSPDADRTHAERPVPCPAAGQGLVGVTPPEAIVLAESLRRDMNAKDLAALRDRVAAYDQLIAHGMSPAPCALQGDDCRCIAYGVRPIGCRPTLAAIAGGSLAGGDSDPGAGPESASDHADAVGFGVLKGLSQGLERAGLDAERYELHSALGVALASPDAARRWAAGAPMFEGCQPFRRERAELPRMH